MERVSLGFVVPLSTETGLNSTLNWADQGLGNKLASLIETNYSRCRQDKCGRSYAI